MNDRGTVVEGIAIIAVIILVIAVAIFIGAAILSPLWTQDTVTATVNGKDVYSTMSCSSGEHGSSCDSETHLTVYTNQETLEIHDSVILWEFGEQQKYGYVQVGHRYKFKVFGWQNPIFHQYRSAYQMQEVYS